MPGATAFKLVSVDRVKVKIAVPENEIGSIQVGQRASITVPALDNAVFGGDVKRLQLAFLKLQLRIFISNLHFKNFSCEFSFPTWKSK
jgi:hypothetical protein